MIKVRRENIFLKEGDALVQVQSFKTGTNYDLEIIQQGGIRVKTKSQKYWGLIPVFGEVR